MFGITKIGLPRLRFNLRAVLVLFILFALLVASISIPAHRHAAAVRHLTKRGETRVNPSNPYVLRTRAISYRLPRSRAERHSIHRKCCAWMSARFGEEYFGFVNRIDLVGVDITDEDAQAISTIRELKRLRLDCSSVTDDQLAQIAKCKSLTVLQLNLTSITDAGLQHFAQLPALEELYLGHAKLTATGLRELKQCPRLRTIWLDFTEIGEEEVRVLAELPALEELVLYSTPLDDSCLPTLASMSRLRYLGISDTRISLNGAEQLQMALPYCKIAGTMSLRKLRD